jgi:hypothetical protein
MNRNQSPFLAKNLAKHVRAKLGWVLSRGAPPNAAEYLNWQPSSPTPPLVIRKSQVVNSLLPRAKGQELPQRAIADCVEIDVSWASNDIIPGGRRALLSGAAPQPFFAAGCPDFFNHPGTGSTAAKEPNMLIDFLGRILLPRRPDWLRRKQIKTMFCVVVASLIWGALLAGFMLYQASKRTP